ncbi:diguanylate cyclase [Acinetobacter lanii]|uniref:Diguanylate cyclase DosC n=1 Tax=Acinetobacter lanii TaxID=2715163 RepID=A0A6G8S2F9_9GAMM|nr:diguanylate cyclase [Acinetobacter lanii]QIO08321.1 diguanylate cyclase [Acinetobacter lanii]
MDKEYIAQLTEQWMGICEEYSATDLSAAFELIKRHSPEFVSEFYKLMMAEQNASCFLTDEMVQSRLRSTLNTWLLDSFEVPFKQNFEDIVKKQLVAGEVHSRIGVPSWLIMHGMRQIKKKVMQFLKQDQVENALAVADYIVQILCFASEIMCRTYEAKVEVHNDVKHSYRLFSAMQDVAVQKDKQRGSLLDWENELMYKVFSDNTAIIHSKLSKSEFGLWFIHKAAYAFSSSDQVEVIVDLIHKVDDLNDQIIGEQNRSDALTYIQRIREKNRQILLLIEQLFQVAEYINSGNDSLTQLLNRRYLSTIVSREINLARKSQSSLTLLAIDADFFKKINDRWGHGAGDQALQMLADVIIENTRGSDYAFRIGGEEFLLLLVDTELSQAEVIAERIRRRVEESTVSANGGIHFSFTVSIGIAKYNGHPDYQRFLDAADTALYAAKHQGRNNVYSV